jgi:hypothetical protein
LKLTEAIRAREAYFAPNRTPSPSDAALALKPT